MASPPHILWQNADQTLTLLDIPQSIADAQGHREELAESHILSSRPLSNPYPSNEPKTAVARAKVEARYHDVIELHHEYQVILQQALNETKASHDSHWCLPRPFVENGALDSTKKRKLSSDDVHASPTRQHQAAETQTPSGLPHDLLPSLVQGNDAVDPKYAGRLRHEPHAESASLTRHYHGHHFFSNDTDQLAKLDISSIIGADCFTFHIPPRSDFYIGDCKDARAFQASIRSRDTQTHAGEHFDFILLDPPWPNRSARRRHKTPGDSYSTAASIWDVREMLLGMRLDLLLGEKGLVGVWLTNKPSLRDLVLGEHGLFACWGVELNEEWLWLKVTASGEPVSPIDGLYRKPFEVLVLGQKRVHRPHSMKLHEMSQTSPPQPKLPKRRVIMAVPDLHSRKPCLKELVESLLFDRKDYRALEVFARHLVAGWTSWGDECIKFNWEGYWRNIGDIPTNENDV